MEDNSKNVYQFTLSIRLLLVDFEQQTAHI